jgi:hypothetical protein
LARLLYRSSGCARHFADSAGEVVDFLDFLEANVEDIDAAQAEHEPG